MPRCASPHHLLHHERRLRVALLPAPRPKHARRRLQRAKQRRHDDAVGLEGGAQRADVAAQGRSLAPAKVGQVGVLKVKRPAVVGAGRGGLFCFLGGLRVQE